MLSRCFLDFSVGEGVFVTGLSQISSLSLLSHLFHRFEFAYVYIEKSGNKVVSLYKKHFKLKGDVVGCFTANYRNSIIMMIFLHVLPTDNNVFIFRVASVRYQTWFIKITVL